MFPDEDAEVTDATEVQDDELDDGTTDAELDAAEAEGAEDERDEDSREDDDERGHEGDAKRPDKVVGRGERDYGRLRAERREAQERADRLERELAETRRAQLGRSASTSGDWQVIASGEPPPPPAPPWPPVLDPPPPANRLATVKPFHGIAATSAMVGTL